MTGAGTSEINKHNNVVVELKVYCKMIMEQHFMGLKIVSIFLFFVFLKTPTEAREPHCKPVRCNGDGPNISFPFYLDGQPKDCGLPGFELICRSNITMIRFPSHRELVMKSISYRDRRLGLLDPGNCVHEVFLNLNLSKTPFNYYYTRKSYNYINCSRPLFPRKTPSSPEIPCLSGPGYHVYTVKNSPPFMAESSSCKVVKTAEIPFPYSPFLSDNSFGLGLTWESAVSCNSCVGNGNRAEGEGLSITTAGLSIAIFVLFLVATVKWVKIRASNEQDEHVLDAAKPLTDGR